MMSNEYITPVRTAFRKRKIDWRGRECEDGCNEHRRAMFAFERFYEYPYR